MPNNSLLLIYFLILLALLSPAMAEDLRLANRWDFALQPYRFGLQGALMRTVNAYRTTANDSGIEPNRDRQVRAEQTRMTQLLHSRGYYQAAITPTPAAAGNKLGYRISLGQRYRIAAIRLSGQPVPADKDWQSLEPGDPLDASRVIAQQAELQTKISANNCFFEVTINHQVVLDHEQQEATIEFLIDTSEPAVFGPVNFVGAGNIDGAFLYRTADVISGRCFDRSKVDAAVINLIDTGIFTQVVPVIGPLVAGEVAVSFQVRRRAKRNVTASVGWASEAGAGLTTGWLHRDLFGSAQSLQLNATLQTQEQSLSAQVVIPSFFDYRNRFSWLNEASHSDYDLETFQYSSTASVERKAGRSDYYEFGIGLQQINEYVDQQWQTFRQLRVPLEYRYDSVANPFNPSAGWRANLAVEPVFDIEGDYSLFFKTRMGAQAFSAEQGRLTLATRLQWSALWTSTVVGSSIAAVPETELYSAGGSSTVRGYAFQSIGANSQLGLINNELRLRFADVWGLVGFWDRATVVSSASRVLIGEWYDGIGIGMRYFTSFTPLRLDFAVPINQRADDAAFLVYVSLGQAF